MIEIQLESLDDLREICGCVEYCLGEIPPDKENIERVRKLAEKLRSDLKKERQE